MITRIIPMLPKTIAFLLLILFASMILSFNCYACCFMFTLLKYSIFATYKNLFALFYDLDDNKRIINRNLQFPLIWRIC